MGPSDKTVELSIDELNKLLARAFGDANESRDMDWNGFGPGFDPELDIECDVDYDLDPELDVDCDVDYDLDSWVE